MRRHREAGITLPEVLVVLAIIGLIASVAVPAVTRHLGKARTDTARVQVETLTSSVELFRIDVGRYPTASEGLQALVVRPGGVEGWNGPYIRRQSSLIDPWGTPYQYRIPGERSDFDIFTLGADKAPAGEGENRDVGNW
nr:type II secretion system major pseudopilin GspG [Elioraea tepidiphila]